jgi:hypothetical protein
MRTLLYILILANVLFFAWAHWVDTPLPGAHQPSPLALIAAPTAKAATAVTPPAHCAALGPLTVAADATALKTALQARDMRSSERQASVQQTEGYWVYIDKLTDAPSRSRALQRLSRAGVRDAAALADSGQVSVGLFSEQAGADKRAVAVRAAGFEPVIEARTRNVDQYWLDVNLPGDVPLPSVAALIVGLSISGTPQWGVCP